MNKMQEMKVEKMKKMLPLLTLLALAIGGGFVIAQVLLSKPYASTGVIITSADFKIYSDVGCTTEITNFALGNLKRGDVVSKTFYLKFITAPEVNTKIKWTESINDPYVTMTAKFEQTSQEFDWTVNTLGGQDYAMNTITSVGKYKLIFTVSATAPLEGVITETVLLTAEGV